MDDLFKKFKGVNVFTLKQSAFLLAGIEHPTPGPSYGAEKAQGDAWLVQLVVDAKSGALPFDRTMLEELSKPKGWNTTGYAGLFIWEYAQTTREDLITWCRGKGIEPCFLFPPQGTSEPATTPQKTTVPVEPAPKSVPFSARGGRNDQWLVRWKMLSSENPDEKEMEIAEKIAAEYNLTSPVKLVDAGTVARTIRGLKPKK